jgi:hypothetical protein
VFAVIAAVIGVVASVVGIMVGVQQLRGNGNPSNSAAETGQPQSDQAAAEDEAGATSEAASNETAWAPENTGAELVLTTVRDGAGDCQYLHVDFDAAFEGTVQPVATSALHAEPTDDLIWNPCENTSSTVLASLTSAGTAKGAAIEVASPTPEDCMDAVNAAGGANATLNLEYRAMDSGLTGLSAGTSLCIWNVETSRLTIASSEGMEMNETYDQVVQYWVTTYLQS